MIRADLLRGARNVLCIGAHSDDIEIGVGGTILRMISENPELNVSWVLFSADTVRQAEARQAAAAFLEGAGGSSVVLHNFRDGHFPFVGSAIKDEMESLKARVTPDIIFTHHREDRHQDHRLLSDLTWNTWRNHLILEYEIPKYDGDLGQPNIYVPLDEPTCRRKIDLLTDSFKSQLGRTWFTRDTFMSLMRLRGVECASPTGFAEAFHGRKVVI